MTESDTPQSEPGKTSGGGDAESFAAESQRERWAKYGSNVLLTSVLVILVAAVVIYAAQKYPKRADLTIGGSQSLKPQTLNVIKGLKQPIKVVSLYAKLKPNQVGQVQDFQTPVVDLLDRYQAEGHNIQIEVIDPVAEPAKLDAWLGEVTRKYGGNVKAYRDVLTQFPKTIDDIKKLADAQAKEMMGLKGVQLSKEEQADIINEAFSTVRAFPSLLDQINEGVKGELKKADTDKKIPDYKGEVENVRSSLETFSRQVDGVQKDLDVLQKDTTAPQQVRDLAKNGIPQFQQMKKLADESLAKIKGLGELKLDEIRRQITTEDENGDTAVHSIAVEGDNDFRLIKFGDVWKKAETGAMLPGTSNENRLRFNGEQQITAAILALEQSKKPKVAFIRGGGPPLTSPMFGQADFSDIADRLRSYNFEVLEKDLSGQFAMQMMQQGGGMAPPEPSDEELKDAVWVVMPLSGQQSQFGPTPVSPEIMRKISDHLAEGGSAMFLFQPHSDGLHSVLADWGVNVKPDIIIVHEPIAGAEQTADDFVEQARRQPPIFVLNQYGDSPVTKTLETLDAALVPLLPVDTTPAAGLTINKILPIPQDLKIWGESDLSSLGRNATPTFDPSTGDVPPPLWSGAVVEKAGKGRIVVIGNTNFVANGLLEFPDPKMQRNRLDVARFPGNGELFTNSVFWLAKMDNLIALSPAAMDTSRIRPISTGVLNFWRVGVLLIGLPLLSLVAGLGVYQWRKE
jgi:ABC-type uncharacterized transport system involved in gliding motility auxiliary subunit